MHSLHDEQTPGSGGRRLSAFSRGIIDVAPFDHDDQDSGCGGMEWNGVRWGGVAVSSEGSRTRLLKEMTQVANFI